MLDKKIILALGVVLLLGCVSLPFGKGGKIISGAGVVVEKLYPDQKEIKTNDVTALNLVITNNGECRATNINVRLRRKGDLELTETPKTTGITLDPIDPATGTPPDKKEIIWYLKAPADLVGTKSYDVGVSVDYEYCADAWSDMLVTTKELERVEDVAKPRIEKGHTKAPVTLDIIAPPALYWEDKPFDNPVTVRIDITNEGGGRMFCNIDSEIPKEDELDRFCELKVKIPKDYLILDDSVGNDLLTNDGLWCSKPECSNTPGDRLLDPAFYDYFWNKTETSEYYILTKRITQDSGTLADHWKRLQDRMYLLGDGYYKSYVLWFKLNKENIGQQQLIPIRASIVYKYSDRADTLIIVRGKPVGGSSK